MYILTYEDRQDYLYVHMEGPESLSAAIQFWEDLSEKAEKEGLKRFLIVDEVDGKLGPMETFELSIRISNLFLGAIIAYVDPKEETFELNKFGGLVVLNRGVLARVFRTENEAVAWLRRDWITPLKQLGGHSETLERQLQLGAMSLEMVLHEDPTFVLVKLSGIRTNKGIIDAWRSIAQISQTKSLTPILVEDHLEGSLSPFKYYALEAIVRSMGLSQAQRIAIADLRTNKTYEDNRFLETVAANRGWSCIKAFKAVQEAEAWLTQGIATPPEPGRLRL